MSVKKIDTAKPLVGIITPCHNNEGTIKNTLNSILQQSYKNFLVFVIDDHSVDQTVPIVKKLAQKDPRIKLIQLEKSTGAAAARDTAIKVIAKDPKIKYVAFLDGDDLWLKDKLKTQVSFMQSTNVPFSYGDYNIVNTTTGKINKYRHCPSKMSYHRMLVGDSIGCLTVMYDAAAVGEITIPNLAKRNDYALWCLILKRVRRGAKYQGILASYKRNPQGVSAGHKFKLIKHHYLMHRKANHFDPLTASFFTLTNVVNYLNNITFRERKTK